MPDTFWNMQLLARLTGKKSDYPPLGLLSIASLLPKDWNISIVDLNDKELSPSELRNADLVFISAMNVQIESVKWIIEQCVKESKTIVAGGSLFTHDYKLFPQVDHFVLNEAELTLQEFLTDFQLDRAKRVYKSESFADLHKTLVPRYDLIDLSRYTYGIIQYSRGCPFECDFCDVTQLYGQKTRTKRPDQIIKELEAMGDLNKLGMVLFADDNLIGNMHKVKNELLPELIRWRALNKPSISFATQVSINLANDEELMTLMLEAGFRHLFIGIETPE